MLDVVFDHLGCDITHTDCKVSPGPEVLAPVLLSQFWELHLELVRGFALEELDQMANGDAGVNGDQDMNMVGSDCSGKDFYVLFSADSPDQVFGSLSYRSLEDFEAVFGDPRDMNLEIEYGMG